MYLEIVIGELLDPDEVRKARRLDIEDFQLMGVCNTVPVSETRD